MQKKIIQLRTTTSLSSHNIIEKLAEEGISRAVRTVERILKEVGFSKLPRRTFQQVGKTGQGAKIPKRSAKKLSHINMVIP